MNYEQIYNQLIDRSRNRMLTGYTEKHHIIPKSMGGSNKKSNIAILTAREHFIAHMLLWKIHKTGNMAAAVWFLSYANNKKISSKTYEILRKDYAVRVSDVHTNKIVSEDTRILIGLSSTGRKSAMKGKSFNLSDDEIKRRSDIRKGKNLGNPGFVGKHKSESIQRMKDKKKGHAPTNTRKVTINGIEYTSIIDACRSLNLSYSKIYRILKSN